MPDFAGCGRITVMSDGYGLSDPVLRLNRHDKMAAV
jgi:hypothetical protein